MVTYTSLPSKAVDNDPSYVYSESSAGAVRKTARNSMLDRKVVTANTSTAYTIDNTVGTLFILTLTGNCTYTFPTATAGKAFILIQKQDATGSRTVTWPAAVKWPSSTAPTLTSTANKADIFEFVSDGTNWFGRTSGQNYL